MYNTTEFSTNTFFIKVYFTVDSWTTCREHQRCNSIDC